MPPFVMAPREHLGRKFTEGEEENRNEDVHRQVVQAFLTRLEDEMNVRIREQSKCTCWFDTIYGCFAVVALIHMILVAFGYMHKMYYISVQRSM